jgi:hypothetical protein
MNRFGLPVAARTVAVVIFASIVSCSAAAGDEDSAALTLADTAASLPVVASRLWKLNLQTAAQSFKYRDGTSAIQYQYALDGQFDYHISPNLRTVLVGRVEKPARSPSSDPPHTNYYLKEAYLSWQPTSSEVWDIGRLNQRFGVAAGFNPTDFFKAGSVFTTTPDPESRRNNRLGSVMLHAQHLWDSGSASIQLSPRLAASREPGAPEADDALSRTNSINRWLVAGSHQIGATLRPQWLVYGEQGHSPEFGLNLNTLLGQSTVVYGEWSGGRSPSLPALAAGRDNDLHFRTRSAFGVTYTLPADITMTLEWQSNGAGVTKGQDQTLAANDPRAWGNTLAWSAARQEAVTRHTLFMHASARNVLVQGLDITGFVQADIGNNGKQAWLEIRKRYDSINLSLQWQHQRGELWTRFGALSERSSIKLLMDLYF